MTDIFPPLPPDRNESENGVKEHSRHVVTEIIACTPGRKDRGFVTVAPGTKITVLGLDLI